MKQVLTTNDTLVFTSPRHSLHIQQKPLFKYSLILLLTGFVLLLSSCQKEDFFSLFHGHHKKTVPFKADFTVTQEVIQAPAPGTPLIFFSHGTGKASHMGKTTYEANGTVDIFAKPVSAVDTTTLTAANGDQIFMNSIGIVGDPDANGNIIVTLTS